MTKSTILAVAAVALATGPVVADSVIERLAPDNAIIIASAPDSSGSVDRFKRTALWRLYQSEAMQELIAGEEGDWFISNPTWAMPSDRRIVTRP